MRVFKKRKVDSSFIDNIWGADLTDVQLISKVNKRFRFVSRVIDIYRKYTSVIPLKNKKGTRNTNAFQRLLHESNRKANKIWENKNSEFYNRSIKSPFQNNDLEMSLTHNEGKSIFAERLIRNLKDEIHKYMFLVSKNVYIDKLDHIANKYNNIYHNTYKMKTVDVKSSTNIDSSKEISNKILNLKLVILLEYQNI